MEYTTLQDEGLVAFELEGSYEYKTSVFINGEIILDQLNDCQQFKKDSSMWNQLKHHALLRNYPGVTEES